MNWFDTWIAAAVGRALAHFLWEGAALALLFAAALAALRRASPQARYLAACTALAAMMAAFAATLAVQLPGVRTVRVEPFAVRFDTPVASPEIAVPPLSRSVDSYQLVWKWVVPVWMAGVFVFYLRSAGGWAGAKRMRSRAVIGTGEYWEARLRELSERMGVTRAVGLLESGLAHAPVLIGFLKPVILLPAGLAAGMRTEQVEAILLHELAHVRRHDYLVNLLQTAVEGLLFYHPCVWWVSRVARRERENCCDDAVIALSGDAAGYAATLATLEELRGVEPALAASGGDLAGRVRRLLRPSEAARVPAGALVTVAALVLGSAAILAGWQAAADGRDQPQVQAVPRAPQRKQAQGAEPIRDAVPSPYEKWVAEDVAYIIGDDERRTFKSLVTDAEREHFIEQFWQRRDPTPDTPFNEFKSEHYRRIAYANEMFRENELPGWKTDRGRIYIIYGPPDEKETHPGGDPGNPPTPPWEEWLYKNVKGIGEYRPWFIDADRTGRFRFGNGRSPAVIRRAAAPGPYQRWLEEDVAYIIHADERAQFEKLTTDAAREDFIARFWATRGVDYKEEHYRRLAYVNEKFAEGGTPGWMSDRGRTYILNGPPDEITKRAAQGSDRSYQVWKYHRAGDRDQVFDFVDRNRDGVYYAQPSSLKIGLMERRGTPSGVRVGVVGVHSGTMESNGAYVIYRSQGNVARVLVMPAGSATPTVRVMPSGSVTITAPVPQGRLATVVLSRVMHTGLVPVFRESLVKAPSYEKTLALEPGTFRLEVTTEGDGPSVTDVVLFQVKAARPAR